MTFSPIVTPAPYFQRIRDNLHGSLDLSSLEAQVVGHRFFQRLRRIKQTAFLSLVFPGATHSRLEHSLGVMHLAGRAWQKLLENQKRFLLSHNPLSDLLPLAHRLSECAHTRQVLRLAALLHDIGHPPFSHSGERFLPPLREVLKQNEPLLPDFLVTLFRQKCEDRPGHPASHEDMSLVLIHHLFETLDPPQQNGLGALAQDICALLSPALSPAPHSPLLQDGRLNLCRELLSGDVDVDRMDYLLRDSRESGVSYGVFDLDRILDSLVFHHLPETGSLHLGLQDTGVPAFEDYLQARQSMYAQLYFHKTSAAAEAMLQEISYRLGGWQLPARLEEYMRWDDMYAFYGLEKINPEEEVRTILSALFVERRLWKRVFEVSSSSFEETHQSVTKAEKHLFDAQIPFQRISSRSSLTKLSPAPEETSLPGGFLRVLTRGSLAERFTFQPVSSFSPLYSSQKNEALHQLIQVTRIYVPRHRRAQALELLSQVH